MADFRTAPSNVHTASPGSPRRGRGLSALPVFAYVAAVFCGCPCCFQERCCGSPWFLLSCLEYWGLHRWISWPLLLHLPHRWALLEFATYLFIF